MNFADDEAMLDVELEIPIVDYIISLIAEIWNEFYRLSAWLTP